MSKDRSLSFYFTCECGEDQFTKVTGRRAKQLERPRYHHCKKCGRLVRVDASSGYPVVVGR